MDMQGKSRDYIRCAVYGGGEIVSKDSGMVEEMDIEDMSAMGIQIRTKLRLDIGESVELDIVFGGAAVQRAMIIRGAVSRVIMENPESNTYGIKFEGLTDLQRADIDEVMRVTCHQDVVQNRDQCGDNACIFRNRD